MATAMWGGRPSLRRGALEAAAYGPAVVVAIVFLLVEGGYEPYFTVLLLEPLLTTKQKLVGFRFLVVAICTAALVAAVAEGAAGLVGGW